MSNPHKRESLGACDELPWGIIFRLRINFRCVSDPIPKEYKFHVGNHVNDKYCKCCFEICLIIYLCARRD